MQGTRRFGAYEVAILDDGLFTAPADILTHVEGEAARARAMAAWGKPQIDIGVNCFLLRGPTGISLIDAGTGTAWGPAFGHARAALAAEGITPAEVERVILTHLHGDHALGLFKDEAAYFAAAEILVPAADLDFFTDAAAFEMTPASRRGGFAIAEQLLRLYAGRIRPIGAGPALSGIEAVALPGHTPGQMGYVIADDVQPLMLWGDALHLTALQSADPGIGVIYDADGALAVKSRRSLLQRARRENWIVSGGHVDGFMRIVGEEGAYRAVPA